jgi:hypothetical protein
MSKCGCGEVYGEVSSIDILALRGNDDIAVELKTSLNWRVIEQAIDNSGRCQYSYVGVPKTKHLSYVAIKTLETYGLGLLTVDEYGRVREVVVPAKQFSKSRRYRLRDYVKEHHTKTIGGVKTGEGPTAYSESIVKIKEFMKDKDWVTAQSIAKSVKTHYTSDPVPQIRDTLKASWNKDWCEYKKEGNRVYFRHKKSTP